MPTVAAMQCMMVRSLVDSTMRLGIDAEKCNSDCSVAVSSDTDGAALEHIARNERSRRLTTSSSSGFRPPPGLEHLLVASRPTLKNKKEPSSVSGGSNSGFCEDTDCSIGFQTSDGQLQARAETPTPRSLKAHELTQKAPRVPEDEPVVDDSLGGYRPGAVFKSEVAMPSAESGMRLSLTASIDAPSDLGVLGMPSAGSAGHHLGMCKPCDFVNRGSCRLGVSCQFCHLCGPGEAQRRRKERKHILKMVESYKHGISSGPQIRMGGA